MKISTILDHIDSGHMALPEFQRGYVWNREQIRGLFDSLYRRHPVGGLLVWATEAKSAIHRGDGHLSAGVVKLLLDGQQRMTTVYSVMRGKPPKFFDGNPKVFEGLMFHAENEVFEFFQPVKMKDDPLWVDVTKLLKSSDGLSGYIQAFSRDPVLQAKASELLSRLMKLQSIGEIDLHVEEISGADKNLDVVVDIFNRVNSGGTKLSKGDLALAKIGAEWPDGREAMREKLAEWEQAGYRFNLDWLLRSVNTVLTGEALFIHLHERSADEVQEALKRATLHIDNLLNLIAGRLGLDHDQVLFGKYAFPLMVRCLDQRREAGLGAMDEVERDKLLFWYVQAAMWGRFSGSTESMLNQDLGALEGSDGGLDKLLEQLRLWHGSFLAEPGNFAGATRGARFYPVLYMLTRMGEARDWGSGLPLKDSLLGRMNKLEVHHIFPRAQLYKANRQKGEVNALANFCFLTKDTNLRISDRLPEVYFKEVEDKHPGALASQWIPNEPELWKLENYSLFLEARQELLANELNTQMKSLLHGDDRWLRERVAVPAESETKPLVAPNNFSAVNEDPTSIMQWVEEQGLAAGELDFELVDPHSAEQILIIDLAWPNGLQEGLTDPVAYLPGAAAPDLALASQHGFRCFVNAKELLQHVADKA